MAPKTSPNILDLIYQEVTDLKILLNDLRKTKENPVPKDGALFKYMPIQDIFDEKLMTRSTFYKYMKEGKYQLYKFGGRSYVDRTEFENAFHKVKLYNPQG